MDSRQTLNINKTTFFFNSLCYNLKKKMEKKMKTINTKNILLVFLATITVFPLFSAVVLAAVPQSAQAERVSFVIGAGGHRGNDTW